MNDSFASSVSSLSDHSENSSDGVPSHCQNSIGIDGICRDYMRNACKRGTYCRYRHPALEEMYQYLEEGKREMKFCHDYQNTGCRRSDCRFIHCTREEEDICKKTGYLPKPSQVKELSIQRDPPICLDFKRGTCRRGARCKYRHLGLDSPPYSEPEEMLDHEPKKRRKLSNSPMSNTNPIQQNYNGDPYCNNNANSHNMNNFNNMINNNNNMINNNNSNINNNINNNNNINMNQNNCNNNNNNMRSMGGGAVTTLVDYQLLEEENGLMRRRIEDLERHVAVLVATNELLLEQNARYRSCKLITVPPIVAVSQVLTPTITHAPPPSRPLTAMHQGPHGGITTMATLSISNGGQQKHILFDNQKHILFDSIQPQKHILFDNGGGQPQKHILFEGVQPQKHILFERGQIQVLPPPPPSLQGSMASTVVDQHQSISVALAPITVENVVMAPCSSLSQQQGMAALSISLSHPNTIMGNSAMVSYPLVSHARLATSSLG